MAKQITTGTLFTVRFGELAHSHEHLNSVVREKRRPDEAKKLLRHCLASEGWNAAKGIAIIFDSRSPIWETRKTDSGESLYQQILDQTYEERKKYYDTLKTSEEPDNKIRLEVFKALYMENDKILRPKYLVTAGTGRSETYFNAMFDRLKGYTYKDEVYPPQPIVNEIPVQYRIFSTEGERILAQMKENDKKTGQYETSSLDKLRSIWYFYRTEGLTQQQAKLIAPGTVGQRGWQFCKLHSLWSESNENNRFPDEPLRPNLEIIPRCFLLEKGDEARRISIGSFSGESLSKLTELIDRSSPDGLKKRNEWISKDNESKRLNGNESGYQTPLLPATAEEVENFVMQRGNSGPKMLPKKIWDNLNEGTSGRIAAKFAKAQLTGTTDGLKIITDNTDVFNRVLALVEEKKSKDVLYALNPKVLKHPLFLKFVEWAIIDKPFQLVEIVNTPSENGIQQQEVEVIA